MGRTDSASLVIDAPREKVLAALINPTAQPRRLPPDGTAAGPTTSTRGGTRVDVSADDVAEVVSAADHLAGMTSSPNNLTAYLAATAHS
ncbi:hypothetical protein [Mycolicibacterium iranicum]|uniref:Uncharacterized protein n=1 Tax=Mycolicibacterium iranicum TaxID=912594 RepID=A0A178M100_MYCIR|nr:hypothetical protein [Mycolicibacterium iranicum]OAN41557.1 hypothetical protein A4X20_13235 [Mycolicibacterium iranicum]